MKRLIIFCVVILCGFTLWAQEDGFSKRIDITKEYNPDMKVVEKMGLTPRLLDTTIVRTPFTYSITPTLLQSRFDAKQLQMVAISPSTWVPQRPFYLKIGGGYPWQSVADIYYTPVMRRNSTLGFYINHEGVNGEVKNATTDRSTLTSHNRVGFFTSSKLGRSTFLETDLTYTGQVYSPYGGVDVSIFTPNYILYNDIRASIAFGGKFSKKSSLSYMISIDGGCFIKSGGDDDINSIEDDYTLGFELGGISDSKTWRKWLPSRLYFDYQVSSGRSALEGYYNEVFNVSTKWNYNFGRGMGANFDIGYIYGNEGIGHNLLFDILLFYDNSKKFVPYISAKRDIVSGSYKHLTELNPYVLKAKTLNDGINTSFNVGAYGDIANFVARNIGYDIYAGAEQNKTYNYFAYIKDTQRFDVFQRYLTLWYVGAKLNLKFGHNVYLDFGGRYNRYKKAGNLLSDGLGIPDFEASAKFRWDISRKVNIVIGADFKGEADFAVVDEEFAIIATSIETLPATIDLNVKLEWNISRGFGIFIEGSNLLDQTIYSYHHYSQLGVNCLGGVKIVF